MPKFFTLLTKDNITSLALGHFDGVHLGHKQLLKKLGEYGGLVVVDKNMANITPGVKRAEFSNYPCFLYEFDDIKDLSGEEFIKLLKRDFKNLKKLVVGDDFKFGKNRAWNCYDLEKIFCGTVDIIKEYKIAQTSVHSKEIRSLIGDGKIQEVNRLLGREYAIEGNVIKGQGIGTTDLVSTLNLEVNGYALPKDGVYASRVTIDYKTYPSVTFIGRRISTDGNFSVETHVIDEVLDSAPNFLEICFVKKIRENKKFSSLALLKIQIEKDIEQAKKTSKICELFYER